MNALLKYFREYFRDVHKGVLVASSVSAAVLIWCNYGRGLNEKIYQPHEYLSPFARQYLLFLLAFTLPYLFCFLLAKKNYFRSPVFMLLLVFSPAFFAWKLGYVDHWRVSTDPALNDYWNRVLHWPICSMGLILSLFIVWILFYRKESFFGTTCKDFNAKPYFLLTLLMVPLIVAASTQNDFLNLYPRVQEVSASLSNVPNKWPYQLLFELSYGSNFFTIELFFRGYLVLAFAKFAGKDAILPMACFYCTIHFGKPLAECISSYFGGILLGIVVYHTRSILGGLIVHLGIAWLMELGAYIGHGLFRQSLSAG